MHDTLFHMPVKQGNPAYTKAPHRFINREYLIISYETDKAALDKILPPGLVAPEPVVKFEFMKMPDASGFGVFSEAGQAISVMSGEEHGTYIHAMYLDSHPPVAGGREIWGFPKTLGNPGLEVDGDHLLGTLNYGKSRVATGTMAFKYQEISLADVRNALEEPCFLVKAIPDVDGTPAICQLVRYAMTEIDVKWAYTGPCSLELHPHAMAGVNELPVKKVLSAIHFAADLTLPYGKVVKDYLK